MSRGNVEANAATAQAVAGVAGFFYTLLAARWLGRADFGLFQAVMAIYGVLITGGALLSGLAVHRVAAAESAVRAAAVVPVADELRGEEVKAFIQLQPGENADPQDIVDFAGSKLAAFKVPRFIEFVDRFNMTPSERIIKRDLLENRTDQRQGAYDAIEKKMGNGEK